MSIDVARKKDCDLCVAGQHQQKQTWVLLNPNNLNIIHKYIIRR